MDKPPLQPLNIAASDLSSSELTPVTSSEGDYAHSPLSSTLQPQTFYYNPAMAQNIYHQQQFNLQYQPNQNLYSVDTSQTWVGSISQQTYINSAPSSLLEQTASLPSSSSAPGIRHDYVPLAKRPSVSGSVYSGMSDGEDGSTHDEAHERRRERRRAQNRAAQRAFRARKEETIKESSTRLDALQEELARLQSNNSNLSETVSHLRAQIAILQRENWQLKRNSTGNMNWDSFDMSSMDLDRLNAINPQPDLKTELSNDSGVFDVSSTNRNSSNASNTTTGDPNESRSMRRGRQSSAAMIAEAIVDAAAALKPPG